MAAVGAVGVLAALEALIAQEVSTQVIGQLVQAVIAAGLAPELAELMEASSDAFVQAGGTRPLDPGTIVAALVKGHIDREDARQQFRLLGQNDAHLKIMEDAAGEPPPPILLLELWRRGAIPETGADVSVDQGIREGLTKDKWIPAYKALKTALPSPQAALQALLEGQTDDANARKLYEQWGGDPRYFDLMFETQGSAPTPMEALEMARRGIIPWEGTGPGATSFEQAFLEGPWRNKWEAAFRALSVYLPPPRTVTAMLRAGSITAEQAAKWLREQGLDEVAVQAYIDDASKQKTEATKQLAVSTVVDMFKAKEIDRAQAKSFIVGRGYADADADFLLDYADFQLIEAQVNALTARIRTLYVGHKISKQAALEALARVGMAAATIDALLAVWDQEAAASPVLLTAVQIADAAAQGMVDPLDAWNELQGRGYDARDAAIVLALHKVDISSIAAQAGVSLPVK